MAISGRVVEEIRKKEMRDPFLRYFKPINMPTGEISYVRRFVAPPSNPFAVDPGVTREAADIFKARTGKEYSGNIMQLKTESEPVAETQTLGKSESELSRRERLKRRKDAAFQFAALQKQGGKAQSGV